MTVALPDLKTAQTEIGALEDYLLKSISVQPPDALSTGQTIAIRAYLILAHATVEEFIEGCFTRYVESCSQIDSVGRAHSGAFLSILQLAADIGGQLKNSERSPQAVANRIPGLYKQKIVAPNHGIRKHNLEKLARGAGFHWPEFEESCADLVSSCETLGAKRGEIAHISAAGISTDGVQQQLYPDDVRRYADDALQGVDQLCKFLQSSFGSETTSPQSSNRVSQTAS